jgi:hypothetical protein
MQVLEDPVALPQYACLLQNLGPDTLYLAEPTVSVGAGVAVAVNQAVTIGASNSVMYAVSDGECDVRILGQGLGMFSS